MRGFTKSQHSSAISTWGTSRNRDFDRQGCFRIRPLIPDVSVPRAQSAPTPLTRKSAKHGIQRYPVAEFPVSCRTGLHPSRSVWSIVLISDPKPHNRRHSRVVQDRAPSRPIRCSSDLRGITVVGEAKTPLEYPEVADEMYVPVLLAMPSRLWGRRSSFCT